MLQTQQAPTELANGSVTGVTVAKQLVETLVMIVQPCVLDGVCIDIRVLCFVICTLAGVALRGGDSSSTWRLTESERELVKDGSPDAGRI